MFASRGGFCVVPALPRFCHFSDGFPRSSRTCFTAGPFSNALGLVIAFVGASSWAAEKLPNLTVRRPLNETQRGADLQPAAAAKFQQWCSQSLPYRLRYRQAGGKEGEELNDDGEGRKIYSPKNN
ncbi:hypothetical protein DPEC_G00051850 [Dallia pectoralis]|uniref:Uncharacterized protein n=1 Tax=Dallia pectoralis TaxID=75939 RepID=A0ACC2HBB6_DALPE|nr:hypothetical protein DPEC_G00051850 [Dallia pectoralis]